MLGVEGLTIEKKFISFCLLISLEVILEFRMVLKVVRFKFVRDTPCW